ncbi:hypothetical protein ElyMa_002823000 [Elysia marginata]|uniref:Nuclear protein MDM1 n=1 Tax=Elysia marginata TaxID=1093978 RepID=A0AAV4HVN2_9GAST|nr:hypothetical protein ElyMa_002823000 [Elysia marginata]
MLTTADMTASYLDMSGNKLPHDWESYLRMRGNTWWDREVDQNKNYNSDVAAAGRMARSCLSECYTGQRGKSSFNLYANTNENYLESRFPPMKSAFNAWISSAHRNASPKFTAATTKPRISSYSPIRNRFSTRFLPLRRHLDTRNESDRPRLLIPKFTGPTQEKLQAKPEDCGFSWSNPHVGQQAAGRISCDRAQSLDNQTSDQVMNRNIRSSTFGSEEYREFPSEKEVNENRSSADQSKSPRRHWQTPRLIDKFWWQTASPSKKVGTAFRGLASHRMPCSPGARDGRQVRPKTAARHSNHHPQASACMMGKPAGGAASDAVARGVRNRPKSWSPHTQLYHVNGLEKDTNFSRSNSRYPDARTVEIERQLMAAREKIRQEYTGFNLRLSHSGKEAPGPRGANNKHLVPYRPMFQPHDKKGMTTEIGLVYYSPPMRNKNFDEVYKNKRRTRTLGRIFESNPYTSPNMTNEAKENSRGLVCSQSQRLFVSESGEDADGRQRPENQGFAGDPASPRFTAELPTSYPTNSKTKRRCKSSTPTAKTSVTPHATSASSKTTNKRRAKRRRGTAPRESSFTSETGHRSASKTTVMKHLNTAYPERPHSAVNMPTTRTYSPEHNRYLTSDDLGVKEKKFGLLHRKPTSRLRRKRTTLKESTKRIKPVDDRDSVLGKEKNSPKGAHSPDFVTAHHRNKPLKMYGEKVSISNTDTHENIPKGPKSARNETILTEPLRKLEEARKKLRALLEAGNARQLYSAIPAVIKGTGSSSKPAPATTIAEDVKFEDNEEGGLCPPQQNPERFLWTEKSCTSATDLADPQAPQPQSDSIQKLGAFLEKNSNVNLEKRSTPLSSQTTSQLEKFPNLKTTATHRKSYQKTTQNGGSDTSLLVKDTSCDGGNPKQRDVGRSSQPALKDSHIACDNSETAKTKRPVDSESSNLTGIFQHVLTPPDDRELGLAKGDAPEVKDMKSSCAETCKKLARSLHPPPTAPPPPPPAGIKKRKIKKRKKQNTTSTLPQDKGADGTPTRRAGGNTGLKAKTYHQLGLAPLVRSPSSENTFHFAVDLGNMQAPTKTKKRRRKRTCKRGSKKNTNSG